VIATTKPIITKFIVYMAYLPHVEWLLTITLNCSLRLSRLPIEYFCDTLLITQSLKKATAGDQLVEHQFSPPLEEDRYEKFVFSRYFPPIA
jgi:hypothetical protein